MNLKTYKKNIIYIIPKGAIREEDVVKIVIEQNVGGRLNSYHNFNLMVVDGKEVNKEGGIEKYIQTKCSWRTGWKK